MLKKTAKNNPNAYRRAVLKAAKLKAQGKRVRVVFSVDSGWTVQMLKDKER